MGQTPRIIRTISCLPIRFYQYAISPCLRSSCRFYPTCSHYAQDAIMHLGVWRGGIKAMTRLLRCHPWAQGGYDPVLPNKEKV